LHVFFSFALYLFSMILRNIICWIIKVLGRSLFHGYHLLIHYFSCFCYLLMYLTIGDHLELACAFFPCPIPFFHEFGELNFLVHKSAKKVHIFWIAFVNSKVFLLLLFGLVFDNRGLFRICMYFFSFPYTFFSWSWIFNLLVHNSVGNVHISEIAFVNSIHFLFLLFGHVFETLGLFITRSLFFPLPYTFFSWICWI